MKKTELKCAQFFFFLFYKQFFGGKAKAHIYTQKNKEPVKESLKLYPLIFFCAHKQGKRGERDTIFEIWYSIVFFK